MIISFFNPLEPAHPDICRQTPKYFPIPITKNKKSNELVPIKAYNQVDDHDQLQENEIKFSKIIKSESFKRHCFINNNNIKIQPSHASEYISSIINFNDNNNSKRNNINDQAKDFQFHNNDKKYIQLNNRNHIHLKFSKEEDERLINIVNLYGARNWRFIEKLMPGRNSKQCRDRYSNYLAPNINRSEWSEEEDSLLIEKFLAFGPKWSYIAQFFHNRTGNDLKNRYNYTIIRRIPNLKYKKDDLQ